METKYIDSILSSLSEAMMDLNLPNTLDTGLNNSPVANNLTKLGHNVAKSILGHSDDVSEVDRLHLKKPKKGSEFSSILYSSIRRSRVFLPAIIVESDAAVPQQEWAVSFKPNYKFLLETSAYPITNDGDYWQLYAGNADKVCFDYKSAKALVEDKGNYSNFMYGSVGSSYGATYSYTRNLGEALIPQVKEYATTMFIDQEDRKLINELLGTSTVPVSFFDSVSLAVVDTANIPIRTSRTLPTVTKYIVTSALHNKDVGLTDEAKVKGELEFYGALPEKVLLDIKTKLAELDKDPGPYGNYLSKFLTAYELGRKNPYTVYTKLFNAWLQGINWIIRDCKNVMGTDTEDSMLYVSNPSQETIHKTVKAMQYLPTNPFVLIRALNNQNPFPLQLRAFYTVYDKSSGKYSKSNKPEKTLTVLPGINNYILQKARDEKSPNDPNQSISKAEYKETLKKSFLVKEMAAFGADQENRDVVYEAVTSTYKSDGVFNSGTLFKFLPPILYQAEKHGLTILTTMEDLTSLPAPYINTLNDVELQHPDLNRLPRNMHNATSVLLNPKDRDGLLDVNARTMQPDDAQAIAWQEALTEKFKSLSEIAAELSTQMDTVSSYGDLLNICNKFAVVLHNLSTGFWTCPQISILRSPSKKQLLGFYNLLYIHSDATTKSADKEPLPYGKVSGNLDIISLLDPSILETFRDKAILNSMKEDN